MQQHSTEDARDRDYWEPFSWLPDLARWPFHAPSPFMPHPFGRAAAKGGRPSFASVRVAESEEAVKVAVDVPGVRKEDLSIKVLGRAPHQYLAITGFRRDVTRTGEGSADAAPPAEGTPSATATPAASTPSSSTTAPPPLTTGGM